MKRQEGNSAQLRDILTDVPGIRVDIIGLEVYKPSEAPVRYRAADDRCVVMLVWTR